MSEMLTGIALSVVGVAIFLLSGVPTAILVEPVLASITVWEILDVLANILAPLIGALIAVIVWLHRRVSQLEEAQMQHKTSLYGLNDDKLASGVTEEMQQLRKDFEEFKQSFDERFDERYEEEKDD